ncbi:hypothetical protein PPRCHA0_2407 [Pseudomonas protegens CHA0]|nr:hypothetical protein PPRCHA0_2407 [Pseudomonas protegens CHA0]
MNTAQQVGIAPEFIILQTDHWVLNHHLSSALPGYLMLGSRSRVNSLAELPESALTGLAACWPGCRKTSSSSSNPSGCKSAGSASLPYLAVFFRETGMPHTRSSMPVSPCRRVFIGSIRASTRRPVSLTFASSLSLNFLTSSTGAGLT